MQMIEGKLAFVVSDLTVFLVCERSWGRVLNRECTSRALREFGCFAVDIQQIIRKAVPGFEWEYPNRSATERRQIDFAGIDNVPAGVPEQPVDVFPGFVFGPCHAPISPLCLGKS